MANASKTRRARKQPPPKSEAAAGGGYKGLPGAGKQYDSYGNVLTGGKNESTEFVRANRGNPKILFARKRGGKRGRINPKASYKGDY